MSDALTYAFADPDGTVCGVARLGRTHDGSSGLVLVFRDGEVIAAQADGDGHAGLEDEALSDDSLWRIAWADGDMPFELEFEAIRPPLALDADSPAGRAGGMRGVDRICRVTGTVAGERFEGLGQRGESSGDPDWERMTLARTLTAWFDEGPAISGIAIRPAGAESHADELTAVYVVDEEAALVADPRISTTYGAGDHQHGVGLELYVGEEDEFPLRAAGEVIAGTSLDLGRLRLDCAFFRWRMSGRVGIGRYDILRRVA